LYVLSFLRSKGKKNIDSYLGNEGIDFPALIEEEYFSDGELALVRLAGNCFNDSNKADVSDTFDYISGDYAKVALEAIKHRYNLN
jgi:hypothetical protein